MTGNQNEELPSKLNLQIIMAPVKLKYLKQCNLLIDNQ